MSPDRSPFEAVQRAAAGVDHDVVSLVGGSPDWDPPQALRDGLSTYASGDAATFDYPPIAGLPALRDWIADYHGVDRERVLVTTGASEANFLAAAGALAVNAGDTVVLTDPAYPYYAERVRVLGGSVRRLPVGPTGDLDPTALEGLSEEVAAVVLNTPNNPTGAVYDEATMAGVAAAVEAADAHLVSDEVYAPFDRSGRFTSALAVTDDAVLVGGFSKSLAVTGFRVGYGVFPPEMLESARRYHRLCTLTASRPAQAGVVNALESLPEDRALSEFVAAHRRRLAERADVLGGALRSGGAAVVDPDGGFYVLADVPGIPGTVGGVETMIEAAGVAGMPGRVFGETTADFVRFSLTSSRVETAARRLEAWLAAT